MNTPKHDPNNKDCNYGKFACAKPPGQPCECPKCTCPMNLNNLPDDQPITLTAKELREMLEKERTKVLDKVRYSWDVTDIDAWWVQIWYGDTMIDTITINADGCGMVKLKDTKLNHHD